MFEIVADYRRQAEGLVSALTARMVGLAALIDPPFTPAKRQKNQRVGKGNRKVRGHFCAGCGRRR